MSEQASSHNEFIKPRERLEQMQAEFDRELEHILEELAVYNFRLATAHAEDQETGEETSVDLATAAVSELDEQWSYHEDWVTVSGLWDITRASVDKHGITYEESLDEPVFSVAISNGFMAEKKDDEAPEIGFSFKIARIQLSNKNAQGGIELLAFARPEKAAFSFARKSAEYDSPDEQLVEAVHYYDGLLKRYTHEASDFYHKSSRFQQQFFEGLINDLTETITAPPYETLCQYAEVPYVYRRGTDFASDGKGLSLEFIETEGENIQLSGTIKGVTILDTLYASDEPLRSKDDLLDPEAGICFIISVNEGSLEYDQVDERDFIVPARLIKDLNIIIK